ncbi:hypothetical protein F5144DRAFT_394167 [Chaetomium tenue]|uniref:Uncharacterized protein n=1 Tax=Chaetomium tenue TaxID=1854479 RepID=A0ACB7NZ85_9PEZI|nr:hypothetical protein F5144DRAFT_394167 [Chaetomium globosum]
MLTTVMSDSPLVSAFVTLAASPCHTKPHGQGMAMDPRPAARSTIRISGLCNSWSRGAASSRCRKEKPLIGTTAKRARGEGDGNMTCPQQYLPNTKRSRWVWCREGHACLHWAHISMDQWVESQEAKVQSIQ